MLLELLQGGVDYSVDTVGNAKVTRTALECTNPHLGVLGMIGGSALDAEVTFWIYSMLNGRSIVSIVEGDLILYFFVPTLVDLYKSGELPVDKLVKYYKFDEIDKAIHDMEAGTTIKPILALLEHYANDRGALPARMWFWVWHEISNSKGIKA